MPPILTDGHSGVVRILNWGDPEPPEKMYPVYAHREFIWSAYCGRRKVTINSRYTAKSFQKQATEPHTVSQIFHKLLINEIVIRFVY